MTYPTYNLQGAVDAALAAGGGSVDLPIGTFDCDPVLIPSGSPDGFGRYPVVVIRGLGAYGASAGTVLRFPGGAVAIDVKGAATTLEGFRITARSPANPPTCGVRISTTACTVTRVTVDRCVDAFRVEGGAALTYFTRLTMCRAFDCTGWGYVLDGFDCGLSWVESCEAVKCQAGGFLESSGLGNRYLNCHARGNRLSAPVGERWGYRVEGLANYSSLHGCYVENDNDLFVEGYQAVAMGGNVSARWPDGRPSFGYRSEVRAESWGETIATPASMGGLSVRNAEESTAWRVWERVSSSLPWLKNTRAVRYGSSSYAPIAVTDHRHVLGPGLPIAANARAGSPLSEVLRTSFTAAEAGVTEVSFASTSLGSTLPGEAVVRASVRCAQPTASVDAYPVGISHDSAAGVCKVRVRADGPGEFKVDLHVGRWKF